MKPALWTVVGILIVAGWASAADNPAGTNRMPQPNVMNPAGMGTVPPTAYTAPNKNRQGDIYAGGGAGNLIFTGDVGSGRQFRGVVPYSSVNRFNATTGNAVYSTFMKGTEPQGYGATPGSVKPYYVPANTVTKMPAPGMTAAAPVVGGPIQPAEAKPVELSLQDLSNQYRPLSRTPQETVDLILKQYPASQTETTLLKAINDVRQQELIGQLEQIKQQADELAKETRKLGITPEMVTDEPAKVISTKPYEPLTGMPEKPGTVEKPADIYDKMLQQLDKDYDEYMKGREQAAVAAQAAASEAKAAQPEEAGGLGAAKANVSAVLKAGSTGQRINPQELNAKAYKLYMDLGSEYMKQKKFYKAAETYALARSYQEKAESFASQGWALLGTGEYMSSAYFLGRAIELDPNTATKKFDLAALLGNDILTRRILDLTEWQQRTYSGEMQFLLGFIYYETGKTRDAEDEIRAAAIKMADYRPATLLKDIIVAGGK